jgi:hypothetical protein
LSRYTKDPLRESFTPIEKNIYIERHGDSLSWVGPEKQIDAKEIKSDEKSPNKAVKGKPKKVSRKPD